MSQRVLVEIQDHIAHVRLNRPEKHNGLDLAMFEAIVEAGRSLIPNPEVRAVVLSGEGASFCAGLDFMSVMGAGPDAMQRLLHRDEGSSANLAQHVAWVWQEVPVPVIAAIEGVAYGGGLQIAMGADMRIARPDAKFSVMEIHYGLIPDMGITQTLLKTMPLDVVKDLVFTGRKVLGEEAQRLGLVTSLSENPLDDAMAKARTIASMNPHAIEAAKRMLNLSVGLDPREAFLLETREQLPLLGSNNQMKAVQAKMMKQKAEFENTSRQSR